MGQKFIFYDEELPLFVLYISPLRNILKSNAMVQAMLIFTPFKFASQSLIIKMNLYSISYQPKFNPCISRNFLSISCFDKYQSRGPKEHNKLTYYLSSLTKSDKERDSHDHLFKKSNSMACSTIPRNWEEELENPIRRTAWVSNSISCELINRRSVETEDGEDTPWNNFWEEINSIVLLEGVASVCDRALVNYWELKSAQAQRQLLPLELEHLI